MKNTDPQVLRRAAFRVYDILPLIALRFAPTKEDLPSDFTVNTEFGELTFICCGESYTSHGFRLQSESDDFDLWLEVRGWANLTIKDKEVYSQKLLSEAPWKKGQDVFEGDAEEFLRVVALIEKLHGGDGLVVSSESKKIIVIRRAESELADLLLASINKQTEATVLHLENPQLIKELTDKAKAAGEADLVVVLTDIPMALFLLASLWQRKNLKSGLKIHFLIIVRNDLWDVGYWNKLLTWPEIWRIRNWFTAITFLKSTEPAETALQILRIAGVGQEKTLFRPLGQDSIAYLPRRATISNLTILRDFAPSLKEQSKDKTVFTVYHPTACIKGEWSTMLAYSHHPDLEVIDKVRQHAEKDIQEPSRGTSVERPLLIKSGTEIYVVPQVPGIQFNPQRCSYYWEEKWHVSRFRFRTDPKTEPTGLTTGIVAYFVGPVLVAEVPISLQILDRAIAVEKHESVTAMTEPFARVFVSYAHEDWDIVEALEQAYNALGMRYLRDVREVRSGENWRNKILDLIDEAEVFQLCWSQAASQSDEVRKEFEHAWNRKGERPLIRPCRWEREMPEPWDELKRTHFALIDIRPFQDFSKVTKSSGKR
jgi:hypothetical protein